MASAGVGGTYDLDKIIDFERKLGTACGGMDQSASLLGNRLN